MADQHRATGSSAAADPHEGSRGHGKLGIWPWVAAFFVLIGGLTAVDVAFYLDDTRENPQDYGESFDEDGRVEDLDGTDDDHGGDEGN